jgi:PAS domain S-box-containing protein
MDGRPVMTHDPVNILLVDDQPAKLLSYEVILKELGETLLKASSAQEAFVHLLKSDVAVVLVDVCMPDLDGFELARMIRDHPRCRRTAIIFISAVLLTDLDFLRGYQAGAVDYVPVPVVPEILRAKIRVFADLYRVTQQLERLNEELEVRVSERTTALVASTAEVRRNEERLRLAFESAQMSWWEYDLAPDRITWSPDFRQGEQRGGSLVARLDEFLDHIHPDDRDRFRSFVATMPPDDRSVSCELRFARDDGAVRWSLLAGQVHRDAQRRPVGFSGIDLDITARKQSEQRQVALVQELDHRAKNVLAVVQSVVRLSRAPSMPELVTAVEGRIAALARAHTLLSETKWTKVDLRRIVEDAVKPFSAGQVTTSGPANLVRPGAAQSLALTLHELGTNAVKYGALSVPGGRVDVSWAVDQGNLTLCWSEAGGPPVRPPERQGFGTKVITSSVEGQLHGRAQFDWAAGGLTCRLTIPGIDAERPAAASPMRDTAPAAADPRPVSAAGRRILVVEDEALIAIEMKETLTALGFAVVGPVSTIPQAMAALRDAALDGAILDLNLGGQLTYPVADRLAALRIPFIFVTGYRSDTIDGAYADVAVLEKPIDARRLGHLLVDGTAGDAASDHAAPVTVAGASGTLLRLG